MRPVKGLFRLAVLVDLVRDAGFQRFVQAAQLILGPLAMGDLALQILGLGL